MRKVIFLGILVLGCCSLSAQYNSLGFGAGSSFFRGESTATGKVFEEPGVNLYGYYTYWLPKDERFQLTGYLNVDYNRPKIAGAGDGDAGYDAHSFVISPLVGMRFYFDKWLLDYVPEKNQDAIFVGVFMGPAIYYTKYNTPSNPTSGENHRTTPGISFNAMIQAGYRIFRNEFWSYEFHLGFQHGFNDRWDGYKGSTGVNDWIFQAGVGMSYSFYQWR